MMASTRGFSILGDSNIKRHLTPMNCRDRPLMSGAQNIPCGRLALLSAALNSVRESSNVCIMSCITNFIASSTGSTTASIRAEAVILQFLERVAEFSQTRPDLSLLICPPMYRTSPVWYREGLPEILQKFSDVMKNRPPSVLLMPSFPTPRFESDGIHLSAYSGMEFVLHLFDSAGELLDQQSLDLESKSTITNENTRVLEDRVMVLEQDHRRLNERFELKSAIDAELSDFQENIRSEMFFMIQGLKRLPKLEPKEWQERAKQDVAVILTALMGRTIPISYIKNSTGRGKDAKTLYKVAVATPALSKEIRDKFGDFFLGGKGDSRPDIFKGISIRNCVTTATLARLAILQLLGKRYRDSNPGSNYKSIGYEARPMLKLFPAKDASDQRIQSFTFIEAVTKLPTSFSPSEIEDLLARISPKLHGNLKSLLVVVSDDMLKRKFSKKKSSSNGDTAGAGDAEEADDADGSETSPFITPPAGGKKSRKGKRGAPSSGGSGPAAKK